MPGERVLLVDSSAAVQDMAKAVLEENGFRVTVASNGLAALSHPDLEQFDLLIVDTALDGISGLDTTRFVKTDGETINIPTLLLVPEEQLDGRWSQSLRGAQGYLAKPFTPSHLLVRAKEAIAEQKLKSESIQFLEESAERHMQELAEHKIQQAVEKKIQIIVERAIQSIVSIIDQRARREVEGRVTALTAEKEQELVKLTVQEVARSMIEKLAERKVTDAMEQILVSTTEKTVKRATDSILPGMIRERLKESIENTLPRELQTRLDKAATEKAAEISEGIVAVIQAQAQKLVPLVAKEKLPELAERQIAIASESKVPVLVSNEARAAVSLELNQRIKPLIDDEVKNVRRIMITWIGILTIVVGTVVVGVIWMAVMSDINAGG